MSNQDEGDHANLKNGAVNRRNLLLASTTLAAASALAPAASMGTAEAQPAPPPNKPNIIMIVSDDFGAAKNHGDLCQVSAAKDAGLRQFRSDHALEL